MKKIFIILILTIYVNINKIIIKFKFKNKNLIFRNLLYTKDQICFKFRTQQDNHQSITFFTTTVNKK